MEDCIEQGQGPVEFQYGAATTITTRSDITRNIRQHQSGDIDINDIDCDITKSPKRSSTSANRLHDCSTPSMSMSNSMSIKQNTRNTSTCSGHGSSCSPKKRTHSVAILRRPESVDHSLKLDPHTLTFCRYRKRLTIACDDELYMREADLNHLRLSIGLYKGYPLAQALLKGAPAREKILKEQGVKQTDHIKGTDGWMKSMCAGEPRAIDNFLTPWIIVTANAAVTTLLHKLGGVSFDSGTLRNWDTVYSLVLKTSLAFLLVFRLNRCAIRFWETRTMWGTVTRATRSLVSAILTHCRHHPAHRDNAIRWTGAYCVACMHFIRRENSIPTAELAGFLQRPDLDKLQNSDHPPLFCSFQIRYYLGKALKVTAKTPVPMAHARTIQMNYMSELMDVLIEQVSGMERVRSTPLPVVYTTHLRTFLFVYMLFLPYIWVRQWGWSTIFLVSFTAFALFGIEGASSEVEIPFNKHRPNHLALDAYCVTILDNIQSLVIQNANLDIQEQQGHDDDDDDDDDDDNYDNNISVEPTMTSSKPPQEILATTSFSNSDNNTNNNPSVVYQPQDQYQNHDPSERSTGKAIDDALADLGAMLKDADKEFAKMTSGSPPTMVMSTSTTRYC